ERVGQAGRRRILMPRTGGNGWKSRSRSAAALLLLSPIPCDSERSERAKVFLSRKREGSEAPKRNGKGMPRGASGDIRLFPADFASSLPSRFRGNDSSGFWFFRGL